MPFSIRPSTIKALIPTIAGNFCDKFLRSITGIPQAFYALVLDMVDESGLPSTNLKTMICALGCTSSGGGGTPNPNMDAPTGVNATDGAFSDKVRVSWNAVTAPSGIAAVTTYKVYRSLSTNTDPNVAALIANVAAPTTIYDDTGVVAGTVYSYWVKASNGVDESAFSTRDPGSAAAPTGSMDAVSDLLCTFGFGNAGGAGAGDAIALVWTPPAGATKYDVYRGTTSTFSAATKVWTDVSPASTRLINHPTNDPEFWDNIDTLLLYDLPPSTTTDFYYWVVAKKDSPPAVSVESNSAIGRVQPPSIYNGGSEVLSFGSTSTTVPIGATKMWVVLRGGGAGGAGGNNVYGAAGGGAPGTVREAFTVTPGDTVEIVPSPNSADTGNAASASNGADGSTLELQINGVTMMTGLGGNGAIWNPAGGGVGGAGESGSGTTSPVIYNGGDGENAAGASGGRSGYPFGFRRIPAADPFTPPGGGFNGDGGPSGKPGSGANAVPINPVLSVGGKGTLGIAYLQFGT